ncbi:hypothetical protein [Methylosinus sp. PW1]|uniref:hypothetical protein n=1 Tax=Methylosinus sp. PW1 TaxID=107636 RepID=UPI000562EED8|nr:hypothetical protein [Methylosinus sp. PW1]
MKVSLTLKKVSVTGICAVALSGCAHDLVVLPPPDVPVPRIADAARAAKLKMDCPERPKPKVGATEGEMAEWSARIVRSYDICFRRNDAKARLIEGEAVLGGGGK